MDIIIIVTIASFIFHDAMPFKVVLTAEQYVQKGQPIQLHCSADFVPADRSAEFLVDKKTYIKIGRFLYLYCFTLNHWQRRNIYRSCASNGRSYIVDFKPDPNSKNVSLSCKMRLRGDEIIISNVIIVTIIDIPSPKMYTNDNLPLISGTVVTLICTATKSNSRFDLIWTCGPIRNEMMSNETTVWSTAELKLNSTYNGTKCTCSIRSKDVDFAVSDFVTLKIENKPILNINDEFHCNSSSTVALVCSARGELTMFGFARWTHTVDGIYIRSLYGITEKYISILIINDCTFNDGGDYTCSAWNKAGDSILWTNKTTLLHFTGPPVILNTMVEEMDTGKQIVAAFYSRSSLVSVKWQCNGVLLNHSIVEQIPMELEIYNKFITLSGYKTSIPLSSHECDRDKCSICLSNEFTGHCEQVYFKKSENGYNVFWVMFVILLCIVAVGISPTLLVVIRTHRNQASQSIQLDSSTNDERYLQIYEPDQIATHQYDAALRTYIDPVPYHSARGYEMTGRPYNDLVLTVYESSRGYDVTSPEYLDVQPDTDTNSPQSDQYEKVD